MSTEAQINANRQNAQKSTGPKTAEGKAAVAQNALKHGFFSAADVVFDESREDYDLLKEKMLAEMRPLRLHGIDVSRAYCQPLMAAKTH